MNKVSTLFFFVFKIELWRKRKWVTCIFCKIINKEIPGKIIYEDDVCIAFLDLSQATYGHTLVIPKKHFENILEVDAQTLAHVMQVTQKLAKQIVEKLNAKGLNI